MGRLVTVSVSTSGGSPVIPLDVHREGFCVAIAIVPTSGSASPTVQHTFQNPLERGFTAAGATWFNHPTLVSCSTTMQGTYTFPVHAIRAFTSLVGDFKMFVIQSGISN